MHLIQDSRYLGGVNELTIITNIRQGRIPGSTLTYKQQLQAVLDSIQNRELRGIPTPIRLIPTIHFARWIIWNDGDRDILIFTSNYDGSMWQYLRDFSALIASDMDKVWGNCENYPPGGCQDFEAFWRYVEDHQVQTSAFFAAIPEETLMRRLSLRTFKTAFDEFMATKFVGAEQNPEQFYRDFCQFVLDNQTGLDQPTHA
ncbi:MAG TPA: hypothetical protein VM553_10020 [Dongiaceae bacterium]|nr:hypothetical protein [Dongiaceae bacterium]